ncbi:uncharacterized protein N0V89_007976 [Didymosphaeria variabile]|uniref:Uncharacterized protein n=1 Tax=Didymosphaeria variabile TaxID=1932322 RepID=A0A9W8XFW8_9PLEO|nr:uncharacterized protein N0V89_007976 [Didymosphaeria variabile]KAJ4349362.1 hypothetical protein N0V89_007976 [Didymosphaeria variabile]
MAIEGTVYTTPENTSSTPVDSSAGLVNDALQYVNELVFGKETAPKDNITVTASVTPPASNTLSAIDPYKLFSFAPGSSHLESPWNQDPIWKYSRFAVALVRLSTWHVLEYLRIFDFVEAHCPIVGQILPFIFFKTFPWIFQYAKLAITISLFYSKYMVENSGDIAAGTVASLDENAKNIGLWVLERFARYLMYALSGVIAMTVRDWIIAILAAIVFLLIFWCDDNLTASQDNFEALFRENDEIRAAMEELFASVNVHFTNFQNNQNRLSSDLQGMGNGLNLLSYFARRQVQSQEARFGFIENSGRALRTGMRQLQQRITRTENRVSVVEGRTDLHRRELIQLQQDAEMERIRSDLVDEETGGRLDSLGAGVLEVATAVEANDLDVRVIRQEGKKLKELVGTITALSVFALVLLTYVLELVDNVKDQATDAGETATKAQQHATNAQMSAANAQEIAASARKFATEIKQQVDTILEQHNDIKRWATEANTKFIYLCSETVKVLTAISSLRGTAVLTKNQIIVLFDKIDPEMAKTISNQWVTLAAQPDDELKIEQWQSEAVRLINARFNAIRGNVTGLREQLNLASTPLSSPIRNQVREVLMTPAPLFSAPTTDSFRGETALAQPCFRDSGMFEEGPTIDGLLEELKGAQSGSSSESDPFVDNAL